MTVEELEANGMPLTWHEDFAHDMQEWGESERGEIIQMLLSPDFVWENMESDDCQINVITRIWYWLKALISLALDYDVHLWAQPNVVVHYWAMMPSQCDWSGYDWRELTVKPGWKLGYDIYNNSSY